VKDEGFMKGKYFLVLLIGISILQFSPVAGNETPESKEMPLPFLEKFDASSLSPDWKTDVSGENSILVKDGCLVINAKENTFANIKRPLNIDCFRASCAVKPAPAVTWTPSIFIYWERGSWLQMGVLHEGGGIYFISENIEGKVKEYKEGKCNPTAFNYIAIELGIDCVRYLKSVDGKDWDTVLVTKRPKDFSAPPSKLILGKGFDSLRSEYQKQDLNNDNKDKGNFCVSYMKDLNVTALEIQKIKMTPQERAKFQEQYLDILGMKELSGKEGPTFESVASCFPSMKSPREVVGVAEHPFDIGIDVNGTIELTQDIRNDRKGVFFLLGEKQKNFGEEQGSCKKSLLDGFLPVVICSYNEPEENILYEQTIYGYSKDFSPDEDLYCYVRLRIANQNKSAVLLKITLMIFPESLNKSPVSRDYEVKPGSPQDLFVKIPYDIKSGDVSEITREEFNLHLEEVRKYWTAFLNSGMQIRVPLQCVNDACKAWLAYSFLNVDKDKTKGIFNVNDGSGFYEQPYGYSVALYCNALNMMGYPEYAKKYLESLLSYQQPDGLLLVNFGFADTGAALYALAEYYSFTKDAEFIKSAAPKMISMCQWITEHRKESMCNTHFGRANVWGLVRYRPYCDFQLPAYDLYANSYLCVGMERTARVFDEIGLKEDAQKIKQEAQAFRQDIYSSMDSSYIRIDGIKTLPIHPDTQQILKDSNYSANGYYGLVASCLLESEFLPPQDERVFLLVNPIEKLGGLVLGTSQFYNQIDHAYTFGYLKNCFSRGEYDRVVLGFYSFLAYGMTRETYSGVECTAIRTGENNWTLPHQYSCTQQLRLLRMMLLQEEGDQLLIAHAIPRQWLENGNKIEVKNAPTYFGTLSYAIQSDIAKNQIDFSLTPPAKNPPKSIRIALRHPQKLPIKNVTCDEKINLKFEGEYVSVENLNAPLEFIVHY